MSLATSPVSDMAVTVKSREVQRGMQCEMSGRTTDAKRHFMAAAHLELVLSGDYQEAGEQTLSRRSTLSAASCFWRAGETTRAQGILSDLMTSDPLATDAAQELLDEFQSHRP